MSFPTVTRNPNRGVELGYAEITSNSSTFTTEADITGLTITVTVGARPIVVEFYAGAVQVGTADKYVVVNIKESTTVVGSGLVCPGPTSAFGALYVRTRLAPSAGSHTYKISALTQSAANGVIVATVNSPAHIRAAEC